MENRKLLQVRTMAVSASLRERNMTAKFATLLTDSLENDLRELQNCSSDLVFRCGDLPNYA